jgi:hypothetical protein
MSTKYSVRSACDRLFSQYPLAIRNARCSGLPRSMILTLEDGDIAKFYVLSRSHGEHGLIYSLFTWPAGRISDIEEEIRAGRPVDEVRRVLNCGVPLPLHGSLFGWRQDDSIIAMIAIYAKYSPPHTEPSWTVMPLSDIPEMQWPPFIVKRFFGGWFWNLYHDGSIIYLSDLIANTPGTVFWVDTKATFGSGSCVVAAEVSAPGGYRLPRGRYVYYRALQAGKTLPSLSEMLSNDSRVDLSPGFK